MQRNFHIHATWDPEAAVWVAESDDVPGLVTEAGTIEALTAKLRVMIPELLEANQLYPETKDATVSFELMTQRQETIRLAS